MYSRYFVIVSPWKRVWPIIWINLNSIHPRMLYAKINWNWPSGFGEDCLMSSMYFRDFFISPPPKKRTRPFFWPNVNSCHQRMLCAKFGQNFHSTSFDFVNDFSLYAWKRAWPYIWRTLNPLHPRMLCAKLSWIWLVVL